MKNRVYRTLIVALALALVCGTALAEIRTTGNVWMRSGPGLSYQQVTSFTEGKTLEFLGETSVDDRGVARYKASDGKNTGWVSSRYSELTGEDKDAAAEPAGEPDEDLEEDFDEDFDEEPGEESDEAPDEAPGEQEQVLDAGTLFSKLVNADEGEAAAEDGAQAEAGETSGAAVELSQYYLSELVVAANEIGLISYRQVESEVPYQYYDDALILAGNQFVENVVVFGEGYEVFGVSVGMSANAAKACMNAAGLDYVESANGMTYMHRGTEQSLYVNGEGYDSCVNLWVNDEGVITEIDWSTFTG